MTVFNPALTTSPQFSFLLTTQGFVQGDFVDDPSVRMQLSAGVIAASVTQPCWGGMAIQESVPSVGEGNLGNNLTLSTSTATVAGFSVFTQAYNGILVPGNSVQVYSAGNTINFFRLGSGARIRVQCSSALITAIESNPTSTQVAWDFTNQQLIPFASGTALPVKVLSVNAGNSKTVSYNSGTGAVSWVGNGNAATILI